MARQAPPQSRQKRSPVAASEDNRWSSPPPRRALLSHLGNKCHGLLQQPLSHGGGQYDAPVPERHPNTTPTLTERHPYPGRAPVAPGRVRARSSRPRACPPQCKAVDGECTARIDDYGRKNAPRSEGDQGQPRASSDLGNSDSRSGRRTDERERASRDPPARSIPLLDTGRPPPAGPSLHEAAT